MKGKMLLEDHLLAGLMLLMLALLFANIVGRYVIGAALAFTEEIVSYLFVYASMIGAASACAKGANMGLSAVVEKLPPRWQRASVLVVCAASCSLFALLLYQGFEMVVSQFDYAQVTPTTRLPVWIFSLSLPLGAALFLFRTLQATWRKLKGGASQWN